VFYGAPFVKMLYLTDLAQKLLSLAEILSLAGIAISACRDVISGRDSYLCMQRCYLFRCKKRMLSQKERAESQPFDTLQRYLCQR